MTSPKLHPLIPPPSTHQAQHHNYVVLHPNFNLSQWSFSHRRNFYIRSLIFLLIAISIYALWPSDPDMEIVRLRLRHVKIHTRPRIAVDISLAATVRVRNMDFYSITYTGVNVAVGYRGKELGHVTSGGGHVRARGSSYVDATVEFNGVEVISGWIYLVDDLAKGWIQFDTVTQVDGFLGFFFFKVPLKTKVSCEMDVNIKKQKVIRQNCYPEWETINSVE